MQEAKDTAKGEKHPFNTHPSAVMLANEKSGSFSKRIIVMLDFLLQRNERRKWVTYITCKSVEIRTRKPVNFQVDGEPVGRTPATFTVVPGALKVIVPRETPEDLCSKQ